VVVDVGAQGEAGGSCLVLGDGGGLVGSTSEKTEHVGSLVLALDWWGEEVVELVLVEVVDLLVGQVVDGCWWWFGEVNKVFVVNKVWGVHQAGDLFCICLLLCLAAVAACIDRCVAADVSCW
jgi:hypothetical protein